MWTPEHLLLGAVSTCYVATVRGMAENSKLEIHGLEVPVEGVIEKQDGGLRFTKITLRPQLTIVRDEDRDRAGKILEKAERSCLIGRSLQSTIVLEAKIVAEAPVAV